MCSIQVRNLAILVRKNMYAYTHMHGFKMDVGFDVGWMVGEWGLCWWEVDFLKIKGIIFKKFQ